MTQLKSQSTINYYLVSGDLDKVCHGVHFYQFSLQYLSTRRNRAEKSTDDNNLHEALIKQTPLPGPIDYRGLCDMDDVL